MGFLKVAFVLVFFAAVVSIEAHIQGNVFKRSSASIFTLKSPDPRYSYVRRYGYYAPDKKDLLEFTPNRSRGYFRPLSNGAIQEYFSGKCFNLYTATNQQVVLTYNCSGSGVATWRYSSSNHWLIHIKTGKCFSPWNYQSHTPRPAAVQYVPGLDGCREYNQILLNYL